jgi:hypothetical protein
VTLTFNFNFGLDHPVVEGIYIYLYIYGDLALQVGGGSEYLHRSPASRGRRRKGNPLPGGIIGHHVPGGYEYGNLALQVGGVTDETVKYGYGFFATRTIE